MKKFKLVLVIIIVLMVLTAVLFGVKEKLLLAVVKISNAQISDIYKTIEVKSTIAGKDSEDVYSFARRKIISVAVEEGDEVLVGDTLCEIKSSYDVAYIEKAKLAVDDAKRQYKIANSLYNSGDMSKNDYENAVSALKNAELNLRYIEEEDNIIVSPINGTVTRVNTKVGKIPLTTEPIFTIESTKDLEMKLEVNENDIENVKVGQEVRVKTKVSDEYIYGKVRSISLTAEDKIGNTTDKIIPVYVDIDNSKNNVFAGITGNAEIIVAYKKNVLVLPLRSIIRNNEETYVYVVDNDIIKKCNVNIVLENNDSVAIEENDLIKEGTKVVISPDDKVSEGKKVKIE